MLPCGRGPSVCIILCALAEEDYQYVLSYAPFQKRIISMHYHMCPSRRELSACISICALAGGDCEHILIEILHIFPSLSLYIYIYIYCPDWRFAIGTLLIIIRRYLIKKVHRSVRIEIDVTVSRMSTHKLLILKREDVVATHNTTPVK